MTGHAGLIFNQVYNGARNFMTPDLIRYGQHGRFFYELSSGMFMNDKLFGVTVLEKNGTKRHDLSSSFPTQSEAEQYIKDGFRA